MYLHKNPRSNYNQDKIITSVILVFLLLRIN
jgi:hypothetical protein